MTPVHQRAVSVVMNSHDLVNNVFKTHRKRAWFFSVLKVIYAHGRKFKMHGKA